MKKWLISCSKDGINVDYEEIIESEMEPSFWTIYAIADFHGCEWFSCEEV